MSEAFSDEDIVPRDQWDRPLIIQSDGESIPYTRVSTFSETLSDSYALGTWKTRNAVLGVAKHEDLRALAAGLDYSLASDRRELDTVIETALDRVGATAKANYGTAIHTFTERGTPIEQIPEHMRPDVSAYQATLDEWGLTVVESERFVVCDELQVAGTLDDLYSVPGALTAHRVPIHVVGDKKTGTLHLNKVAIQIACYAHGKLYDPQTGERTPLNADLLWGLVMHIPAGSHTCEPYWVDLDLGWRAAQMAKYVRDYRAMSVGFLLTETSQHEDASDDDTAPGAVDYHTDIVAQSIGAADSPAQLRAIWRHFRHQWTDDHTKLAKAKQALLEEGVR